MLKQKLLIIGLLFSLGSFAQPDKGYLFLKNGTILKGKYQYFSDLKKYRIESAGNVWVFRDDEIDSVRSFRKKASHELIGMDKDSRVFNRTEIGIMAGNSENSQSAPLIFSTQLNYKAGKHLTLGVGTGIEFYKESYLPAYLNFEYRLRNSNSSPFVFLNSGYLLPLEEARTLYINYPVYYYNSIYPNYSYTNNLDAKGGLLINPGIGYMHFFNQGLGLSFSFGYRYHRLHYKGEKDYALDIDYNRLSVKFGILFK